MDSQLLTLSKIFTERIFRIPDYQRGYAWTEPQLLDFWSDLLQIDESGNHYTGVITLEAVSKEQWNTWKDDEWIIDSKKYEPLFVVDGQQRLTTSIILIQCIVETLSDDDRLNYTSKLDIQRKFIFDLRDTGVSRSYIFAYETDNPSYEFLKTEIFDEFSSTSKAEETIYTNNLEFSKKFFGSKIAEMKKEEVELLFKKVTQQLLFNIFYISSEVDVCVAFETMNNRGRPLSELELLKNRLIYLSLKIKETEYERDKLRRSINDCWKAIYHNLGRNKLRPLDDDLFLSCHFMLYFTHNEVPEPEAYPLRARRQYLFDYKNSERSYETLLEEIFVTKRVLSIDGAPPSLTLAQIYSYVSALQPAVEKWYQIFNPSTLSEGDALRPWLDKLDRLSRNANLPLRLAVLLSKDSIEDRVEVLRKLEQNSFIATFSRYLGYRTKAEFTKEAMQLYRHEVTAKQVAKLIGDNTALILARKSFSQDVRNEFKTDGFYDWSGIRYFLYEYNLSLQQKSRTKRRKLDWMELNESREDYVTVEHIFPQKARNKYWSERFSSLNPAQRKSCINSLGNLVPLSVAKNSSLSNKSFADKLSGAKDETVGFKFGCYAENEVAAATDWNPRSILERGLKLLGFMEKQWDLDFGSESEKAAMLGLSFIRRHSPR